MKYLIVVILLIVLSLPVAGQNCDTIEVKKENREHVGEMFFQLAKKNKKAMLNYNGKKVNINSVYGRYVRTNQAYVHSPPSFTVKFNDLDKIDIYYFCYEDEKLKQIGALQNVYDSQTGEFLGQDFVGWIILND